MSDKRKVPVYWDTPFDLTKVRLEPDGPAYEVLVDEDNLCYVIAEDGERSYIVFS